MALLFLFRAEGRATPCTMTYHATVLGVGVPPTACQSLTTRWIFCSMVHCTKSASALASTRRFNDARRISAGRTSRHTNLHVRSALTHVFNASSATPSCMSLSHAHRGALANSPALTRRIFPTSSGTFVLGSGVVMTSWMSNPNRSDVSAFPIYASANAALGNTHASRWRHECVRPNKLQPHSNSTRLFMHAVKAPGENGAMVAPSSMDSGGFFSFSWKRERFLIVAMASFMAVSARWLDDGATTNAASSSLVAVRLCLLFGAISTRRRSKHVLSSASMAILHKTSSMLMVSLQGTKID